MELEFLATTLNLKVCQLRIQYQLVCVGLC